MEKPSLRPRRKSYMELGEVYFWTATIYRWQTLLDDDRYKEIIIDSLAHLSRQGYMDVFAFVIMPNHVHFIWKDLRMNGKEQPHASFLKYSGHLFLHMLREEDPGRLLHFQVNASNRKYCFWQRDSLAFPLYSRRIAFQKLRYIHRNPNAKRWHLVDDVCDYKYSSVRFYELNDRGYPFLKDLGEEFGWLG